MIVFNGVISYFFQFTCIPISKSLFAIILVCRLFSIWTLSYHSSRLERSVGFVFCTGQGRQFKSKGMSYSQTGFLITLSYDSSVLKVQHGKYLIKVAEEK